MRRLLVICLFIVLASSSSASVCVDATHDSAVDHITIQIRQTIEDGEVGVFIVRTLVGKCNSEETVSTEVYPLPEAFDWDNPPTYEFDVPVPAEPAYCLYAARILMSDGSWRNAEGYVGDFCQSAAYANRLDAPFSRGRIFTDFVEDGMGNLQVIFDPCAEDCWSGPGGIVGYLPPDEFFPLLDKTVDIFGTLHMNMQHGLEFHLDHLAEAPAGTCGPVPNETTTWGGLRAKYR